MDISFIVNAGTQKYGHRLGSSRVDLLHRNWERIQVGSTPSGADAILFHPRIMSLPGSPSSGLISSYHIKYMMGG